MFVGVSYFVIHLSSIVSQLYPTTTHTHTTTLFSSLLFAPSLQLQRRLLSLFPPIMATVLAPPPSLTVRASSCRRHSKKKQQQKRALGDFSLFAQVVRKDVEFLKRGIDNGVAWAKETFRIPEVAKKIDDVVWLRNLEDPTSPPLPSPSWPQPCYPGFPLQP